MQWKINEAMAESTQVKCQHVISHSTQSSITLNEEQGFQLPGQYFQVFHGLS